MILVWQLDGCLPWGIVTIQKWLVGSYWVSLWAPGALEGDHCHIHTPAMDSVLISIHASASSDRFEVSLAVV